MIYGWFLFVLLNHPERFFTKHWFITDWTVDGIFLLLTWCQSTIMMRSAFVSTLLQNTLHEAYVLESSWNKQAADS